MHLSFFFFKCKYKKYMHSFAKLSYKYMKVKHQLELLYFQVHESLKCIDIVLTFFILVIIYQSFNLKIFSKI